MSTTTALPVVMVTQPGDTEPSCRFCRYFTGHTSWCPSAPREVADAATARDRKTPKAAPRRVDLNTASRERIAAEVIGRKVRVVLYERGAVYGTVTEVRNGRTRLVFSDGTTSWGPSGRVTVR